jgi:hypothetical protein
MVINAVQHPQDSLLRLIPIILLAVVSGCSQSQTQELEELNGVTRTQLVERFGEPNSTNVLTMDQLGSQTTAYVKTELQSRGASDDTLVHEYWWDDGDFYIMAWLIEEQGELVVVDAVRWHESVAF